VGMGTISLPMHVSTQDTTEADKANDVWLCYNQT